MKSHSRSPYSKIELLESRIAPASVLVLQDANHDVITFKSSLGNLTAVGVVTKLGILRDGQHNEYLVNLSSSAFSGTNFSVSVAKAHGGDGQLANLFIDASGVNLGTVSIAGDLGTISAGTGSDTVPAIKSLTVNTLGRFEGEDSAPEVSNIAGSVGKLSVKGNMYGTFFDVTQNIDSISIGGSLLGGDGSIIGNDGDIFAGAAIGKVSVRGEVRGGDSDYDGIIESTTTLGVVTVGGSIIGGYGPYSGSIGGGTNVTSVSVAGSVIGGEGKYSGDIYGAYNADGTVGKVTIGGSLVGGGGQYSGAIGYSNGGANDVALTAVVIDKDIIGGSGVQSGLVDAFQAPLGSLTLKGSLFAGSGQNSGTIESDVTAGVISIGGSIYGGEITLSGGAAKLSIGGSIYGGNVDNSGLVSSSGTIGVLNIRGDVIGGYGIDSGSVQATGVSSASIGGEVIPGIGTGSGVVTI